MFGSEYLEKKILLGTDIGRGGELKNLKQSLPIGDPW